MEHLPSGDLLPNLAVTPPGPRSLALAEELRRFESPNVTYINSDLPVFWKEALGSNVLDVDGNVYVDFTAGFAVAATGHRNPSVSQAIRHQLQRLVHGLGDVHPPDAKVELLRRLAEIAPGGLQQSILASSGAEAVEAALKTARLASGRPGVLAFSGAYHGLTYGALAVTDGELFRGPFTDQLGVHVVRAPFPNPHSPPAELEGSQDLAASALRAVASRLDENAEVIGAVIVEPIQGRAGVIVPPQGFIAGLREECDRRGLILIFDEIYTGFARTGRWFACQHEEVVPELLCVGKALTGALPFSACIGRPEIMGAWPASTGEAMHTSTFLGHPLACAAALAQIAEIERRDLVSRAERLGAKLRRGLEEIRERSPELVADVRGRGMLAALQLGPTAGGGGSAAVRELVVQALRRGLLLLGGGDCITLTPPLTISEEQLDFGLSTIQTCLSGT